MEQSKIDDILHHLQNIAETFDQNNNKYEASLVYTLVEKLSKSLFKERALKAIRTAQEDQTLTQAEIICFHALEKNKSKVKPKKLPHKSDK